MNFVVYIVHLLHYIRVLEGANHLETISKLMAPFIIICFGVNYPAGSTPILTFPLRGKGFLR